MSARGPEILTGFRGRRDPSAASAARLAESVLRRAGAGLGLSKQHEISLTLCDGAAMRAINRRWRGKDKATDVLSFPQHEARPGLVPPPGTLGDIVVALPVTRRAAKEFGVSFERHFARLLIHGLLHLLGHDHEGSERAAVRMEKLEEKLLGDAKQAAIAVGGMRITKT